MLINKTKRAMENLKKLPSLPLAEDQITFLASPSEFKTQILTLIKQAKMRIYVAALYWEHDEAGQELLDEIYRAKLVNPELDVKILVDWHRNQRNLLGAEKGATNANWYADERAKYQLPQDENMFFGVPINTREVFGVLHVKGFVFDDTVLYSGASLNNVYLHQFEKYRYDRYHQITDRALADSMVQFMRNNLLASEATYPLDALKRPTTKEIRTNIRAARKQLAANGQYHFESAVDSTKNLKITPIFGLGAANNALNETIEDLFQVVQEKLVICTPYFNLPRSLQKKLKRLLTKGKQVEIIVGDKTANDFYIPPNEPFKMAGALPYLYESNLRRFSQKFAREMAQGQLTIRLWKNGDNSYHLKGIWVDKDYMLLTGNNLNPRARRLDAENGLLISDPKHLLRTKVEQELTHIRQYTAVLQHYSELEKMAQYPESVQKLLKKFARIKADKLVKMIL